MKKYSKEIELQNPISVREFPDILGMQETLGNHLIVVRDHHLLFDNDFINTDDEIYLFLAVMGG